MNPSFPRHVDKPLAPLPLEAEHSLKTCFAKQVEQTPHRVALHWRGKNLTYLDLDRLSTRVSCYFRSTQLQAPVALILDRSPDVVVAMLAAIKSEIPYVSLDPRWPEERLRLVLEEIEPALVIVDTHSKRKMANVVVPIDRCVGLDYVYGKITTSSVDQAPGRADSNALAYILYTSGSAGSPKGVMQTQGNVVRHIRNYAESVSISADDRVSLLASYAVDAAVMDIYLALLRG